MAIKALWRRKHNFTIVFWKNHRRLVGNKHKPLVILYIQLDLNSLELFFDPNPSILQKSVFLLFLLMCTFSFHLFYLFIYEHYIFFIVLLFLIPTGETHYEYLLKCCEWASRSNCIYYILCLAQFNLDLSKCEILSLTDNRRWRGDTTDHNDQYTHSQK